MAACTAQLKTYIQMWLNGDWVTIVDDKSTFAGLGNTIDENYVDEWLSAYSNTNTDGKALFFIKSGSLSATYKLYDPMVVELRALTTAPWLPIDKNITSQAFTVTMKYECEDNTSLSQSWSEDPNYTYLIGNQAGDSKSLTWTATSTIARCDPTLQTSIEILLNGQWTLIKEEGSPTTADAPAWVTLANAAAGVGTFDHSVSQAQGMLILEAGMNPSLIRPYDPVKQEFRMTTRDPWSEATITDAWTITF